MYLECVECNKHYDVNQAIYRCLDHNYPLLVKYDYEKITSSINKYTFENRPWNLWRYKEILPIKNKSNIVSLGEGGTVLIRSKHLAKKLGLKELYLKDETRNPTWSFKDRGSSVGVSVAKELGLKAVGCVSSGNMAASMATYSAQAGLKGIIIIRSGVPKEKIIHVLVCGSEVIGINKPYPEVNKMGLDISEKYGVYWVHNDAPMRIEGQKTSSLEIWEQLGHQIPDKILVPTSSGGNMSGHWKGWEDLYNLKLIDKLPSMVAVQNAAAQPIYNSFIECKTDITPVIEKPTIAVSICNPDPPSGKRILKLLKNSDGLAERVDDNDMLNAQKVLGETEGIFSEPGGASSIAALIKLVEKGDIDKDESIVCIISGAGIKDVKSASKMAGSPKNISTQSELENVVESILN